ncbi:hypothetical protein PanWU01x14_075910, partial [Parasponia andersonii]
SICSVGSNSSVRFWTEIKLEAPEDSTTAPVFCPPFLPPTSDQFVVATVELVSMPAVISDHSRPLTRLL